MIPGNSTFDATSIAAPLPFPEGGGELGTLIRIKDWTQTPLGDFAGWPAALHKAVSMILASRFPMMIFWGAEGIQLYNDAFRAILDSGDRHPRSLGQPARECWSDCWQV